MTGQCKGTGVPCWTTWEGSAAGRVKAGRAARHAGEGGEGPGGGGGGSPRCAHAAHLHPRARNAEGGDAALAAVQSQLPNALAGAREQHDELRDVNAKNAALRRSQREAAAASVERDSEIRSLQRILTQCEEMLAQARAALQSLLDQD